MSAQQLSPADRQLIVVKLWAEARANYAYWDRVHADWDSALTADLALAQGRATDRQFFRALRRLLALLGDGESDVRALFFYGEIEMHEKPWYGFQHLYAEYRLQAPEASAASDDASMENLTVIIDRIEGSNVQEVRAIEEVLAALKPLVDRGVRIRVTRSQQFARAPVYLYAMFLRTV